MLTFRPRLLATSSPPPTITRRPPRVSQPPPASVDGVVSASTAPVGVGELVELLKPCLVDWGRRGIAGATEHPHESGRQGGVGARLVALPWSPEVQLVVAARVERVAERDGLGRVFAPGLGERLLPGDQRLGCPLRSLLEAIPACPGCPSATFSPLVRMSIRCGSASRPSASTA